MKIKSIIFSVLVLFGTSIFAQTKTYGLIQKLDGNDENGFLLFAPQGSDSTFLMDKCGQLVHSWQQQYVPAYSSYLLPNGNLLRTGIIKDPSYGPLAGRGGIIEELDWDNNLVWRYALINDSLVQHHDIFPMPNGNVLVLAWHIIDGTLAENLGRLPQFIPKAPQLGADQLWGERILELKKIGSDSAEIVWQWDVFDHIIQDIDILKPNYGVVSEHPELMDINYGHQQNTADWLHGNAIAYSKERDQIVLSCHNQSEIWIIDHSTSNAEAASHTGGLQNKGGDILYRWGNPAAYQQGGAQDRRLFQQHNPSWIPNNYLDSGKIMIFNNGNGRDTAYSSVEVIAVPDFNDPNYSTNLPYQPVNSYWSYKDSIPADFYSRIISGAQRLPNGNTLICSGVPGKFFEVTPEGKKVWHYQNPVAGSNRRADGSPLVNTNTFRCEFYPNNFPAFDGKLLSPMGALERNSIPYSCNTGVPFLIETIPPHKSMEAVPNALLVLQFNKFVTFAPNKHIDIFENGDWFDSLNTSNIFKSSDGNNITLRANKNFALGSRISVSIDSNVFIDVYGLGVPALDSNNWWFYIQKTSGINILKTHEINLYPNPSDGTYNLTTSLKIDDIRLFDVHGKLILNVEPYLRKFDFTNLQSGSYTMLINKTYSVRLIKI